MVASWNLTLGSVRRDGLRPDRAPPPRAARASSRRGPGEPGRPARRGAASHHRGPPRRDRGRSGDAGESSFLRPVNGLSVPLSSLTGAGNLGDFPAISGRFPGDRQSRPSKPAQFVNHRGRIMVTFGSSLEFGTSTAPRTARSFMIDDPPSEPRAASPEVSPDRVRGALIFSREIAGAMSSGFRVSSPPLARDPRQPGPRPGFDTRADSVRHPGRSPSLLPGPPRVSSSGVF